MQWLQNWPQELVIRDASQIDEILTRRTKAKYKHQQPIATGRKEWIFFINQNLVPRRDPLFF